MLLRPSLSILTLRSARPTSSEPATKRRLAPRSRHPPAPSRGQRHPPRLLAEAVSWRSAGRAFRDDKAEVPVVQPSGDKASAQVPRSCHVSQFDQPCDLSYSRVFRSGPGEQRNEALQNTRSSPNQAATGHLSRSHLGFLDP